jgi:DNA polymerase-3 subunit delta
MINKVFELNNIDLKIQKFFLFYGENNGHKNEIIKKIFNKKYLENTYRYEENEIINNEEKFFADILSSSFFENEKLIIISRASDKIKVIIEEIIERKVRDLTIILNANILEKKSKLRAYFEKNKETCS